MTNRKKIMVFIDRKAHEKFKEECKARCIIKSSLIEAYIIKQLKKWKVKIED